MSRSRGRGRQRCRATYLPPADLTQLRTIIVLRFLDIAFVVIHGALVLFNVTGWAWRRTRRWHLYTISLTLLSWVGLGLFFGFGYCPCTDWHWDVKRALGERGLPASYIKYYLDRITGTGWDPAVVDVVVLVVTVGALAASVGLNLRDRARLADGSPHSRRRPTG